MGLCVAWVCRRVEVYVWVQWWGAHANARGCLCGSWGVVGRSAKDGQHVSVGWFLGVGGGVGLLWFKVERGGSCCLADG